MSEAFGACDRVRVKETGVEGYVCRLQQGGLIHLAMADGDEYQKYAPEELELVPDPIPEDRNATQEIVCPYCGYEFGDSWELRGDHSTATCGRCGKDFHYARYYECTYNTSVDEKRV